MSLRESHDRHLRTLFDKIKNDRYPSGELMDRVETMLDPNHAEEYVNLLISKTEETKYPSKQMLDRIARLIEQHGQHIEAAVIQAADEQDQEG